MAGCVDMRALRAFPPFSPLSLPQILRDARASVPHVGMVVAYMYLLHCATWSTAGPYCRYNVT